MSCGSGCKLKGFALEGRERKAGGREWLTGLMAAQKEEWTWVNRLGSPSVHNGLSLPTPSPSRHLAFSAYEEWTRSLVGSLEGKVITGGVLVVVKLIICLFCISGVKWIFTEKAL